MKRIVRWWSDERWLTYEKTNGTKPGLRRDQLRRATWHTRIVDLTQPIESIWGGMRKSYRQEVRAFDGNGYLRLEEGETGETFLKYCRPVHRHIAGVTRPDESWNMQAQWIDDGLARCFFLARSETPISFIYLLTTEGSAYYFSGASIHHDVGTHALHWRAIEELKDSGTETYELGWQKHAKDPKGKSIEFFKRGFGGVDVPARIE